MCVCVCGGWASLADQLWTVQTLLSDSLEPGPPPFGQLNAGVIEEGGGPGSTSLWSTDRFPGLERQRGSSP